MLQDYVLINDAKTFAFSAENMTGERGGGARGGDCTKLHPNIKIAPGETAVLMDTDGPAVIEHIWLTGYCGHSFIMRIYWDGQEYPSVEAPVSAFFGNAYDETEATTSGKYPFMNSAVLMLAPGKGLNSYFEMPFKKHCRITIENRGKEDQWLYYCITGSRREVPENIGYFHASYRQAHPVTRGKAYTVIDGIQGQGQFLGLTLATGMNGNNTCWVEGEARMYIDDDVYPSLHYTGTEDYFCGSYGFGNDIMIKKYQEFTGLYAGMYAIMGNTGDWYNSQQRFMLYRFHVKDPIRFSEGFRMTLDNLGWTGPRYDDYTSCAYWYQTLPSAPLAPLPTDEEMVMK